MTWVYSCLLASLAAVGAVFNICVIPAVVPRASLPHRSLSALTSGKSAYADGTWVIKINNDRLVLLFSQGKTPGAALL